MMRHAAASATERASDRRRISKIFASGILTAAWSWSSTIADEKSAISGPDTKIATAEALNVSIPRSDKPQAIPAEDLRISASPLEEALKIVTDAQQAMKHVQDYVCVFVKQERIGNSVLPPQTIQMKARTDPGSIYFSFQTVHKGREAIYFPARFSNKLVAHEGGWKGYVAGTLHLDPRGRMAMADNRHPISEAGIDKMITRVYENWHQYLQPQHIVRIERGLALENRSTTLVHTRHGRKEDEFEYHMVKLYFDDELRLPVRFIGYDWPKKFNEAPPVVEDYQFRNLRINVGLSDRDFDPANPAYSFK